MELSFQSLYEQIKANGKPYDDGIRTMHNYIEAYIMPNGTRAYIYKALDKEHIIKIEFLDRIDSKIW